MFYLDMQPPFWMRRKDKFDLGPNEYADTFEKDLNNSFVSKTTQEIPLTEIKNYDKLKKLMYKDFWRVRNHHGLGESPLHSSDENEEINNKAFHELRPKFRKGKLKDFLMKKSAKYERSLSSLKSRSEIRKSIVTSIKLYRCYEVNSKQKYLLKSKEYR